MPEGGLAVVIAGATTTITLEGLWLGLVLPRTLSLSIGSIFCDVSRFNVKEHSGPRLVFEGYTNALLSHTADNGSLRTLVGQDNTPLTVIPEIPNPSTAQITIESRQGSELMGTCPVTFGKGVSTSAQWLVRDTNSRMLTLAVQYAFLGVCMTLHQEEVAEAILRDRLNDSSLFKSLVLLITRVTQKEEKGTEFHKLMLEALQPHTASRVREMNLGTLWSSAVRQDVVTFLSS
jgi:hypothetical protein